jgi:hypothetical protein
VNQSLSETQKHEAVDIRADGRRRFVTVAQDRVVIARSVGGVAMRITIAPRRYAGVLLSLARLDGGGFGYEVRLAHADPDLCVTLAQVREEAEARTHWRHWADTLALPRLVERIEGERQVERDTPTRLLSPTTRRRGSATQNRRPRFLCRRKVGVVDF